MDGALYDKLCVVHCYYLNTVNTFVETNYVITHPIYCSFLVKVMRISVYAAKVTEFRSKQITEAIYKMKLLNKMSEALSLI